MTEKKRNKPTFFRNDWHKKIKLGSTVKKKRKWRGAKGRQSKVRLNRKGHPGRPRVGWGEDKKIRNLVDGLLPIRIENSKELDKMRVGQGAIIGRVGLRKRKEIIAKANKMKIKILNKYRPIGKKDATD